MREQLADRVERVRRDVQPAALRVGRIGVGAGADHQLALVGLADIGVDRVRHHHAGEARLDRLRYQRLQRIALERHAQPGHRHHDAGAARRRRRRSCACGSCRAWSRRRDTAPAASRWIPVTSQFCMMSTPQRVRGAGIAPGDRIVPGGAAAPLQGGAAAPDSAWQAAMLSGGQNAFACSGVSHSLSTPFSAVRVDVALEHLHVMDVVREHHHAALAEHDVVVQLLRQALPELHRMVVERRALVEEIVRADDRGVAPGIAAADPALLQHGDVAHAVLAWRGNRRRQPMPAAADDDRVVRRLRLRRAPLRLPALVPAERIADQGEGGEALHRHP